MAQLKDLLVNGASRLIGDAFVNKIQITTISAPTSSGGTTYGPGTSGQVLKSNGTSIYWTSDNNSVTGVKGNSESSYRTGNVNITAGNIGLGNVENKSSATIRGELTSSNVTTALGFTPYNSTNPNGYTTNTGTVTKVTAGTGLAIGTTAQGNFTTTGTINHTNSVTAQTTQALYPIKIDACGHISAYGTAVTSLPASDVYAWAKTANKPDYNTGEIIPILTKEYPAYTCSTNDTNNAVLFFANVAITDTTNYYTPWWVHYRIYITTTESATQGWYDCYVGINGSSVCYHMFNNFYSTDYRPIYHHSLLYPKSGQSTSGAYIGVRIQSARNVTSLARVIKVEILDAVNCTVTLRDSLTTYQTLYNSTNFYYGEYTGSSQGLYESGDADSGQYYLRYYSIKAKTAIVAGNIIVGTTSGFEHLKTGNAFDINYPVLYASSAISANSTGTNNYIFHYAISTGTTQSITLTNHLPVFIQGTLSGTTFTPVSTTPLTQTIPTAANGYYYYYIGKAYNTSSISFDTTARAIYAYIDGAFRQVSGAAQYAITAGKAVQDKNGNQIDTTYLKLSGGTMTGTLTVPTVVGAMSKSITIGDKSYDGSDDIIIEIADLGLAGSSMEFKGIITNTLSDGATTSPVTLDGGGNLTPADGNVVIDATGKEYIWSSNKWHNLGIATDFALSEHKHGNITNAGKIGTTSGYALYTTTNGLITAGSLSTNSPSANGSATSFIDTISQDTKGKITVTKKNLDTSGTWSGNATTATKATQDSDGNAINTTYLKLTGGNMTGQLLTTNSIWAGTNPDGTWDSSGEHDIGTGGPGGMIYFYNTDTGRGIYTFNSSMTGASVVGIDNDNNIFFNGNAATASAIVTNSGATTRKVWVTTSASVPSGAAAGDIVLVKV